MLGGSGNRKRITVTVLSGVALALWMFVIFGFSASSGTESSGLSDSIAAAILSVVDPSFSSLSLDAQQQAMDPLCFFIRKLAHFLEYAVLGALAANFAYRLGGPRLVIFLFSWLVCVLFAGSDEFHQLFVDGRSGQLADVCIDSCGSALGTCIFSWVVLHLTRKRVKGAEG